MCIRDSSKGNWLESLLFAVSVAVGLTPEMLPMIVTTNLAKGAVAMARRKTIVKRLNAIQNFGAMDILCTDKTGTLTQNKIILERHLNVHGKDDLQVLEFAWLNSHNQTGLKNLLDVAVLDYAVQHDIVYKLQHYKKIDEIPFDFMRRRMSVVVRDGDGKNLMVCKGAIEEMLPLCVSADNNGEEAGGVLPFTAEMRKEVRRVTPQTEPGRPACLGGRLQVAAAGGPHLYGRGRKRICPGRLCCVPRSAKRNCAPSYRGVAGVWRRCQDHHGRQRGCYPQNLQGSGTADRARLAGQGR